jgi:hypothetical protein
MFLGARDCECAMDGMRLENMDRVWPGLSAAPEIPALKAKPPLGGLTNRNLWITSRHKAFRAHLKAVAYSKPILWDCRVYSDKDLVETWLRTAKAQGHKIYDSEIANYEGSFVAMDIAELVEPPQLAIIILGVKEAPNKESPNVLLEAVRSRMHLNKPTWLVDQQDRKIDSDFHRCYSEQLETILSRWSHLEIEGIHTSLLSGPSPEIRRDHAVASVDIEDLLEEGSEAESEPEGAVVISTSEEEEEEEDAEEETEDSPMSFLSNLKVESEPKKTAKRSHRKGRA